jgi:riboflavin synthase
MFKGIVEGTGKILKIAPLKNSSRLTVAAPFALGAVKKGDSIAVNGCCLTVIAKAAKSFDADLSHETLDVTNLKSVRPGSVVNLERPLRLSDRIDGHIVQGHIDGVGRIRSLKKPGDSWEIEIAFPKNLRRYLIPKGSVAVDGISMTVNRLTPKSFTLVVIPHTFQATNLKAKRAGDPVNLEVDLIGKYLESLSRYGGKKT